MISRIQISRVADAMRSSLQALGMPKDQISNKIDFFKNRVHFHGYTLDAVQDAMHGILIGPDLLALCNEIDDPIADASISNYLTTGRLSAAPDSLTRAMLPRTYLLMRACGVDAKTARLDTTALIDQFCRYSKFGTVNYKDAITRYFNDSYPQVFAAAERAISNDWQLTAGTELLDDSSTEVITQLLEHFQGMLTSAIVQLMYRRSGRRAVKVALTVRLLSGEDVIAGTAHLYCSADGRLVVELTKYGDQQSKRSRTSVSPL